MFSFDANICIRTQHPSVSLDFLQFIFHIQYVYRKRDAKKKKILVKPSAFIFIYAFAKWIWLNIFSLWFVDMVSYAYTQYMYQTRYIEDQN